MQVKAGGEAHDQIRQVPACLPACLSWKGNYWLHILHHYNKRSYLGEDHSIVTLRIQNQVRCYRKRGREGERGGGRAKSIGWIGPDWAYLVTGQ
jgi:hypothetical protein